MTQLLQFARVEADKRANKQVGTVLLDTLYCLKYESTSSCFQTGEGPIVGAFSVTVKADGSFSTLVHTLLS